MADGEMTTMWRALERQVHLDGDRVALTELRYRSGDAPEAVDLTYRELHDWARSVAAELDGLVHPGESVLLFYATGVDFAAAFFACLFAGVPAVPVPPPRRPYHRIAERVSAIVEDAGVRVAASAAGVSVDELAALTPQLSNLIWLDVNALRPGDAPPPDPTRPAAPAGGDDIAYLQYTSGSTSSPKGVQVTHANLVEQIRVLDDRFRHDRDSVMITWLPVFHDMGLIYTLLTPLVLGFPAVLMKPEDFVADPRRWLRQFSTRRGTHTMAPNFGYDLCVRKVRPAERAGLDLRSWRVAANASEPIRAETINTFTREYAAQGLPATTHRSAYGLAEATLIVTGVTEAGGTRSLPVDRQVLGGGTVRLTGAEVWDVPSCGPALDGFDLRIVDPESRSVLPEWTVGEIWVAGPCVARGYYRNAEATRQTFHGRLRGDEAGGTDYLRTGDLGFLADGELYVTGRRKDIIIVRGQNHYPQDIEHVAERAHPALRPGCGAAFALDDADEQIVLAYEVRPGVTDAELTAVAAAVRAATAETFGLGLYQIAFLAMDATPKTSSGKIRRAECRRRMRAGELGVRATSGADGSIRLHDADRVPGHPAARLSPGLLRPALRRLVAEVIGVTPASIDDDTPLTAYGLDSARAAELTGEIERFLRGPVPPTLMYDSPTLARMTTALLGLA
jgi:acyl-CoA synthetase (AMP-forming)/AMP-acid ligase II/aryl carrier-like protein